MGGLPYTEILDAVIQQTTEQYVTDIIDDAIKQILILVRENNVARNTGWPDVVDYDSAEVYLRQLKVSTLNSFRQRRSLLISRLENI